jgi:hypothetical protein
VPPERIPQLLGRAYSDIVPHLLQRVKRDDLVLQFKDENERHDDREAECAQDRTRRIDVGHDAFGDEVPLLGADKSDQADQPDHPVKYVRNPLFHHRIHSQPDQRHCRAFS